MGTRVVIDGNTAYEIDEDCAACREKRQEARAAGTEKNKLHRASAGGRRRREEK